MKRFFQRVLACLLSAVLVCGLGGVSVMAADTEGAGIQTLASLTPDDWSSKLYHLHTFGDLEMSGAEDGDTIALSIGDSLVLTVSPYAHVQYVGCDKGEGCGPGLCNGGDDQGKYICWYKDKGCCCNGKYDTLRLAAVTVTADRGGIISSEEICDYSGLETAGDMTDGTIVLTAETVGTVHVTVDVQLYDWQGMTQTFTIKVTDPNAPALPAKGAVESGTYVLPGDYTAEGALTVAADADVTIDLNGYVMHLYPGTTDEEYGIDVHAGGTLTVGDTSADADGYITCGESYACAVCVSGIFHLCAGGFKDIVRTGPSPDGGTAVFVNDGGMFYMSGGTISDCSYTASAGNGGGVGVGNGGTCNLSGGEITNNKAQSKGGGVYVASDTDNPACFTMSGTSVIYGNSAEEAGADIYIDSGTSAAFTIRDQSDEGLTFDACHVVDGWYEDAADSRWSKEHFTAEVAAGDHSSSSGMALIAAYGAESKAAHTWDTEDAECTWARENDLWTYSVVVTCSVCGEQAAASVAPTGVYTGPTCTEDGYTTYRAELVVTAPDTEEPIGTFADSKVIEDPGTALGHAWSDWEITKEAAIGEAGEKTRVCTRCGATETETYTADDDGSGRESPDTETPQPDDGGLNGLHKDADGVWRYYEENVFAGNYTGYAANANGKWYVEKGVVTFTKTGILKDSKNALRDAGAWYYVINSKVQTDFTGLSNFRNENGWWYIRSGKVDFTHNGVDKNKNGWWYVTGGKVQFGFTGLANYKNSNGWWYIRSGKVDFTHNGVDKNKNGWWYVTGGKVQFGFTGLANYRNANGWWYIRNGRVDFTYEGFATNRNGTWYVRGGKVRFR